MASSVALHHLKYSFFVSQLKDGRSPRPTCLFRRNKEKRSSDNVMRRIKASSVEISQFPLLQPPKVVESFPSELESADPDFYKIGYVRSMRAYGVQFMEGPNGFGVYASKDVQPLSRARMIMEIPLELMLTVSKKPPWMFFPDIIPVGHPIFDIINSTDPELDWDLRLACLLLYSFDCKDNFWQLYGDFLPSVDESTSLLLASEEDLLELQDENLSNTIRKQQNRALEFWERNWHSGVPLKIKRLARDPERFIWAVGMAQSRCINMEMRVGALVQEANMLVPYAVIRSSLNFQKVHHFALHVSASDWREKIKIITSLKSQTNHKPTCGVQGQSGALFKSLRSYGVTLKVQGAEDFLRQVQPNCFFHWRFRDRMLEVMINAGQLIKRGEELTVNYMDGGRNDMFLQQYGFSSPVNPWDVIEFSGNARIHLDSFLSVFNIAGLPEEYYHDSQLTNNSDSFVDGAVIAAARTLPTWTDGDMPPLPSIERKAAKDLQEECHHMLSEFPTTSNEDQNLLDSIPEVRRPREAAIRYRLHKKQFIEKVVQSLEMYEGRLLF